jgi:DNA-binding CsgD family transcriptional regulator
LNISPVTVSKHLETARKALGVRTNHAAIKKAFVNDLIAYK